MDVQVPLGIGLASRRFFMSIIFLTNLLEDNHSVDKLNLNRMDGKISAILIMVFLIMASWVLGMIQQIVSAKVYMTNAIAAKANLISTILVMVFLIMASGVLGMVKQVMSAKANFITGHFTGQTGQLTGKTGQTVPDKLFCPCRK